MPLGYQLDWRSAFPRSPNSAALCAVASQHVFDIGGKRRVGVDSVLDLAGRDAKAHRHSENIVELLAGMTYKMCAENAVCRLIDDDLRPRDSLRIGSGGKPVGHVIGVNLGLE